MHTLDAIGRIAVVVSAPRMCYTSRKATGHLSCATLPSGNPAWWQTPIQSSTPKGRSRMEESVFLCRRKGEMAGQAGASGQEAVRGCIVQHPIALLLVAARRDRPLLKPRCAEQPIAGLGIDHGVLIV